MADGTPPRRLQELLAVSALGGLVNVVGLVAFGHHHHHGHSHSHGGGGGGCSGGSHKKTDEHSHSHSHSHSHDHGHQNENMQGIFLHVLADLMGSVAVVASTLLTMYTGYAWWDAAAGLLVSVLIVLAAWPLVGSSARNLLLAIPEPVEYNLRNTLAGIAQQRGVVGYSVPKFWMDDTAAAGQHHHHHHHHHDGDGGHGGGSGEKLRGIVHVVAAKGAGLDDVRDRVREHLARNGMDVVVQVEREGDSSCWCGAGRLAPPATGLSSPWAF